MGILDEISEKIRHMEGKQDAIAQRLGVSQPLISSIKKGAKLKSTSLATVIEALGGKLLFPEDKPHPSQDVRFVAPRVSAVVEYKDLDATAHPPDENYLAVPLVADRVAAGQSTVTEGDVSDWVIVYNGPGSGLRQGNKDYFCVRVGKNQTSMIPTIHPGDILLVDPSDRDPGMNGRKIMLVKMPAEIGDPAEVAVKRVNLVGRRGERSLMIYSDNVAEYPPLPPVPLSKYADNENEAIERAIGGRVVWAWSDMTKR